MALDETISEGQTAHVTDHEALHILYNLLENLVVASFTDGYVVTWDTGTSKFTVEAPSGGGFTQEQIEDFVGAMVTGNTETNIAVTYDDAGGKLNFVVATEDIQDIVGAMVSGGTETGISVTYDDTNGRLDFVVDAELAAIAGLTSAADRLPYFTGSGTASLATFTAAGRALVDDADAAAQRTTLGLGAVALLASIATTDLPIQTAFKAYATGTQSIPNSTWTKITLGSEVFDVGTTFASSTFTVPSGKAGLWLFAGQLRYAANATGTRNIGIYKNGTLQSEGQVLNVGAGSDTFVTTLAPMVLAVSDTVELYGIHNRGSALTLVTFDVENNVWLFGAYLGRTT